MNRPIDVFERLMETVRQRSMSMPEDSYTTRLFAGGVPKIGKKITEEAGEVVEAAAEPGEAGRLHLIHEVADLWFHTMVMMAHCGVDLEDVAKELERREGMSGLEEKRRRGTKAEDNLDER